MPDSYEVRIRGPIGPLMQACLPGWAVADATESTVLTGAVAGPVELQKVLDLLTDRGLAADNVRLTSVELGGPSE